ncbi:hypothetical protein DQ04_10711010 [Trypanosoma grayi]|uniref:hypothetical protein n=1 Tax=Trypanosoma grayi TaxID=71804 RepID=UPI0004F491EA|nr:hypothetical protein DQ04_10711010 [Trypanosoma grayi]KEG07161.1 hypothetical protein DQ04_10711010 [Trypanosoma grayi]
MVTRWLATTPIRFAAFITLVWVFLPRPLECRRGPSENSFLPLLSSLSWQNVAHNFEASNSLTVFWGIIVKQLCFIHASIGPLSSPAKALQLQLWHRLRFQLARLAIVLSIRTARRMPCVAPLPL